MRNSLFHYEFLFHQKSTWCRSTHVFSAVAYIVLHQKIPVIKNEDKHCFVMNIYIKTEQPLSHDDDIHDNLPVPRRLDLERQRHLVTTRVPSSGNPWVSQSENEKLKEMSVSSSDLLKPNATLCMRSFLMLIWCLKKLTVTYFFLFKHLFAHTLWISSLFLPAMLEDKDIKSRCNIFHKCIIHIGQDNGQDKQEEKAGRSKTKGMFHCSFL